MSECLFTLDEVRGAFFAAPPAIAKEIKDYTLRTPSFIGDAAKIIPWNTGQGTAQMQLEFRGELPPMETDFSKWAKLRSNVGCDPCQGPGCGYNITKVGGFGFNQKIRELMQRELVSEEFCIADIQTTADFKQVFSKLVENLYRQVAWMKEVNINFNYLTQIAKKFVVDSGGPKANSDNPYVYRPLGTARISALNPQILEFFYEWMVKMPEIEPYDVVQGAPVYALVASKQIISHMYRDDPNLRQDIRFSGYANDLITKYNFVSTIQGQFFPVTWMWPRRFNNVGGQLVQVLPTVQGIPMNYGTYSGLNPAYESATLEEVLLMGKTPLEILVLPTETSLGENTSFGPEPSYFDYWKFVNPETVLDPLRRSGFFITSAKISVSSSNSEGVIAILVERPSVTAIATFLPGQSCPPTPEECTNEVPAVGCPCPLILSVFADPITAGQYFITLSAPTTAVAEDEIQLGVDTGGYVTATVVSVSSDDKTLLVTISGSVPANCQFVSIYCDNTQGCSASVLEYNVVCTDTTRLTLILSNPIKADTAADVVTLYYGDGTSVSATVVSADQTIPSWVVDIGGTAFCDQVGGVVSICVPTATDASCPACGSGPVVTQCT